jgi:hypothetical protein
MRQQIPKGLAGQPRTPDVFQRLLTYVPDTIVFTFVRTKEDKGFSSSRLREPMLQ